jgi:hypothetical protein
MLFYSINFTFNFNTNLSKLFLTYSDKNSLLIIIFMVIKMVDLNKENKILLRNIKIHFVTVICPRVITMKIRLV